MLAINPGGVLAAVFFLFLFIFGIPSIFPGWLKRQQQLMDDEDPPVEDWVNPGKHEYPMYFFLGQSGCGKDTHVLKLLGKLQAEGVKYIYVSIGDQVRGLIEALGNENYFAQHMKHVNDQGKLQPASIPLHFFLSKFIPEYTGEEVIIINGSPRSHRELKMWASLIQIGYLPNAKIIHIDVTDDECRNRLANRPDRPDTEDATARETKLAWYKPIRKWLNEKLPTGVEVVTIDGMRPIDDVAQSIEEFFVTEDVLIG